MVAERAAAARAVACRSSRSPGNGSSQYLHDPRTSMSKPDSCMYFLLSHNAGNTQPVVVAAVVVRHSLEEKACSRPCALGSATAAELICSCESARGATPEVHPRVGLRLSRARALARARAPEKGQLFAAWLLKVSQTHIHIHTSTSHTKASPRGGFLKGRHAHGELEAHGGCGESARVRS